MDLLDGLDQDTAVGLAQLLRAEYASYLERGVAVQVTDRAGTFSVQVDLRNQNNAKFLKGVAQGYVAGRVDGLNARGN